MSFRRLEGQDFAKRILGSALASGRPPHAWLFEGPPGCGKKTAAFGLAASLVDPAEGDAARRVEEGKHPDVRLLSPAGASFKVEQVRDLLREAALRPFEGARRVFILDRAEALTDAAANALLKQLEEPQASLSWILVTTRRAKVLPTIASRCSAVRFFPLDEAVLRSVLSRELAVDERRARDLAALSGGSVREAAFLEGEEGRLRLELAEAFIEAQAQGPLSARLAWSRGLEGDRAEAREVLALALVQLRELWAEATGLPKELRLLSKVPERGRSLRPAALQALMDAVARCQRELLANVNVGLALDALALALEEDAA